MSVAHHCPSNLCSAGISMLLIGRGMTRFLFAVVVWIYDLIRKASRIEQFEVSGVDFANWLVRHDPNRCDFDLRTPGLSPLPPRDANSYHRRSHSMNQLLPS